MLELVHRSLSLMHAVRGGRHLVAQRIGILTAHTHLDQRLNLRFDAIELDRDELGILHTLPIVVEAKLTVGDAVLQRANGPLVAAGLRGGQTRVGLTEPSGELLLTGAAEKAVET